MFKLKNRNKQIKYALETSQLDDFYALQMNCSKLTALFWVLNTLKMLDAEEFEEYKENALKYAQNCLSENGGFSPEPSYPTNLTSTLSGLQIFLICKFTDFDVEKTRQYISTRFNRATGAFSNDEFGDFDTRVDCCAILSLKLLDDLEGIRKKLHGNFFVSTSEIALSAHSKSFFDVELFVTHILNCYNSDGGFSQIESGESHAAQVFCCLSCLKLVKRLDAVDLEQVCEFLVKNQCKRTGGLMGRVNKKVDVCYSFWSYSAYKIASSYLNGENCYKINEQKLTEFILSCEHEDGGFSDRPGNVQDIYHQMFALASLSLLGLECIKDIDIIYSF